MRGKTDWHPNHFRIGVAAVVLLLSAAGYWLGREVPPEPPAKVRLVQGGKMRPPGQKITPPAILFLRREDMRRPDQDRKKRPKKLAD